MTGAELYALQAQQLKNSTAGAPLVTTTPPPPESETHTTVQHPVNEEGEPEGFSALLFGESGSGKTWALTTLIEAGLELFVLGTEPRFLESLKAAVIHKKLDLDRLHTCHVYPATASWASLIQTTLDLSALTYEQMTLLKSGMDKRQYGQFVEIYRKLFSFTDDRTKKEYGPVDQFGPDKAFAIDSVTGLAYLSMDLIVGAKPVKHQGEWGVAMDNLERFNNKCTSDIRCFFVMTGHVERETNPSTGATLSYISTLGAKLSPKWGRFYSEVIHCYREGPQFWWSTDTPMFSTKQRSLPLSNKIIPSFVPLVKNWHLKKGYQK